MPSQHQISTVDCTMGGTGWSCDYAT